MSTQIHSVNDKKQTSKLIIVHSGEQERYQYLKLSARSCYVWIFFCLVVCFLSICAREDCASSHAWQSFKSLRWLWHRQDCLRVSVTRQELVKTKAQLTSSLCDTIAGAVPPPPGGRLECYPGLSRRSLRARDRRGRL